MPETHYDALEDGVRLERSGLLEKALSNLRRAAEAEDPAVVAEALRHQADVHRARCDWDLAIELARRSGSVAEGASRADLLADALNAEAAVYLSQSDWEQARPLLRRMLEVVKDPRIRGIAYQNLGLIAAECGDLAEAHRHFSHSSACFRDAGYDRGVAVALVNASRLPLLRGQHRQAAEEAARAAETARELGDLELLAVASLTQGEALLHLGEHEEAERCAAIAFGHFSGVGNDWRRVECLRLQGDLHAAQGDATSARRCYQRALELAGQLGARLEAERLEARLAEVAGVAEGP